MLKIKVLLFAEAKERAEADFIWVEVDQSETTAEALFSAIGGVCKDLVTLLPSCQLAQNHVCLKMGLGFPVKGPFCSFFRSNRQKFGLIGNYSMLDPI